jgi:hypothetical protein
MRTGTSKAVLAFVPILFAKAITMAAYFPLVGNKHFNFVTIVVKELNNHCVLTC